LIAKLLVLAAVVAYPAFRLSFTALAIRADRCGEIERGQELRKMGFTLMVAAMTVCLTLALAAVVVSV